MWPYRTIVVREEVVVFKNRPTGGEASSVVGDSTTDEDENLSNSDSFPTVAPSKSRCAPISLDFKSLPANTVPAGVELRLSLVIRRLNGLFVHISEQVTYTSRYGFCISEGSVRVSRSRYPSRRRLSSCGPISLIIRAAAFPSVW